MICSCKDCANLRSSRQEWKFQLRENVEAKHVIQIIYWAVCIACSPAEAHAHQLPEIWNVGFWEQLVNFQSTIFVWRAFLRYDLDSSSLDSWFDTADWTWAVTFSLSLFLLFLCYESCMFGGLSSMSYSDMDKRLQKRFVKVMKVMHVSVRTQLRTLTRWMVPPTKNLSVAGVGR